jgi:FtsP/CotA-like multicopper oxidase with cupredoxin domain
MKPALYVPGNTNGPNKSPLKMVPKPTFTAAELASAKRHTYDLGKSGSAGDSKPWNIKVDGASAHTADTRRVSAAPNLGDLTDAGTPHVEVWSFKTGGGWSHPMHVHFEEGQVLTRDGKAPPIWEAWARKDIFRVGPEEGSSSEIEVAFRFREFAGTYVEHCHNTTHEDHAMLIRFDIERPGQTVLMPAPVPTWDGVGFVTSVAESKFRTGL